ncbi:MAG: type V CRISPR-associated protein Cas12a/Cpf1 [Clostridiales bacterium]|nr:type V CRISPR-associated protein Cas12a/Cpf1 [Clostridiales bacterium]
MKEQFINQYPISKTLQFSLIPIGKTEENFNNKLLLEEDEKRAEEYQKVKEYIDRYHKFFIETALLNVSLNGLEEYVSLYFKPSKSDADVKAMSDIEAKLRKQISKAMTSHELYKDLFSKDMIDSILPKYLQKEEERSNVEMFRGFSTYFQGFYTNRKNMYSEEAQSTAISYRCINDNLPKFLDNVKSFEKIREAFNEEKITTINEEFFGILGKYATDIFNVDYFNFVLSQPGIDKYNKIIGGYVCSDGTKIQGLNELINLYNQQVAKSDKSKRLPLLKMLYKQILSDRESVSFIPEKYKDDNEIIASINEYFSETALETVAALKELFDKFSSFDLKGVYISSGLAVTSLSNDVFGSWNAFSSAWETRYSEQNPKKKNKSQEKYDEELKANFKKNKSFSLDEFQQLGSEMKEPDSIGSVLDFYAGAVSEKADNIRALYIAAKELLTPNYAEKYDKKLIKNHVAVEKIKSLLDAVKSLEKLVKPLLGTGKEEEKDNVFYGKFLPLYDSLTLIDRIYDKVRNYVTQKPYSKDKIKLNFENPQLLSGWDKNKESDCRGILLRRNGNYYLGIIDKSNSKVFQSYPVPEFSDDEYYEKIIYKQINGCSKYFSIKQIKPQNPPENIIKYLSKDFDKKTMTKGELVELIKYVVEDFIPNYSPLLDENGKCFFDFKYKPYDQYTSWNHFCKSLDPQAYTIRFSKVKKDYIDNLIEIGFLYLFQIYNKDFSEYSHGTPNLHTLYFKTLFDKKNFADVVFKLSGGAEMFFRKASIKENEKTVHPANQPIINKNPDNSKKQSEFSYDLVKDKRYTKRQFSIHIPITINFKANGREFINYEVRRALNSDYKPCVIGIDRGERNLIYITVINDTGEIVEQMSLNEIISDNGYKVDYQKLLDKKEKARDEARKSWGTIENIKELKEGYISQVIHKICELVIKYDAVIAMEDLNFGFKRGRFNVEKQVYQKFENMLISKLNYLCDKKMEANAEGGVLKAYQLTNKFDGVNKGKQNGIIFYVPAWLTSKIDPVTGFVDLLHPKYTSVEESHNLFGNFDDIRYNAVTDMFEFDLDYSKFPKSKADFKKKWTVCTNSDRIMTFRNPAKNSEWDNKRVILTDEFKKLFEEFGVDYKSNLREKILGISNPDFNKRLVKFLALTLQMRNSVTGSTNPEDDYLISPVRDKNGVFYDSRNFIGNDAVLPADADANGAYNIARKGLWAIDVIKSTSSDMLDKADLSISNAEWLEYVQK